LPLASVFQTLLATAPGAGTKPVVVFVFLVLAKASKDVLSPFKEVLPAETSPLVIIPSLLIVAPTLPSLSINLNSL
jgi:hypothetical protein